MADNTVLNIGSGGDTIATDELTLLNGNSISGVKVQRVKLGFGADSILTDIASNNGLPITGSDKIVTNLQSAATTVSTGSAISTKSGSKTLKVALTGTGAITATIEIYGNNDNSNSTGILLGTFTMSGTTSVIEGTHILAEWPYMYSKITAISGTSAAVTVSIGV